MNTISQDITQSESVLVERALKEVGQVQMNLCQITHRITKLFSFIESFPAIKDQYSTVFQLEHLPSQSNFAVFFQKVSRLFPSFKSAIESEVYTPSGLSNFKWALTSFEFLKNYCNGSAVLKYRELVVFKELFEIIFLIEEKTTSAFKTVLNECPIDWKECYTRFKEKTTALRVEESATLIHYCTQLVPYNRIYSGIEKIVLISALSLVAKENCEHVSVPEQKEPLKYLRAVWEIPRSTLNQRDRDVLNDIVQNKERANFIYNSCELLKQLDQAFQNFSKEDIDFIAQDDLLSWNKNEDLPIEMRLVIAKKLYDLSLDKESSLRVDLEKYKKNLLALCEAVESTVKAVI